MLSPDNFKNNMIEHQDLLEQALAAFLSDISVDIAIMLSHQLTCIQP